MTTAAHNTRVATGRAAARGSPALDLAVGLLPLLIVAVGTRVTLELPARYLAECLVVYLALAGLVLVQLPATRPGPGLGVANRVTLARAAILLPLVPLPLHGLGAPSDARWWIVTVAGVALALDAVDGWAARRRGATRFGARFDMEVDAVLLLVLSVLTWTARVVGPWVVLIGGFRYLFVAGGWVWPWLRAELSPSLRRKTVCALQGIALLVCLAPATPSAAAPVVAALALAVLVYSFAVDIVSLWRDA